MRDATPWRRWPPADPLRCRWNDRVSSAPGGLARDQRRNPRRRPPPGRRGRRTRSRRDDPGPRSPSMPPPVLRVFVSSTWIDLQPERQAVEVALARLRETKFIGMEHFGSRAEGTREVSLLEVGPADLYVGIIGGRYGS